MSYGDSEDEEEPYDDEDAEKFAEVFCSNCPVRKLCLEYGKKYGNGFGVYGGLLPHERLGN